MSNSLTTTIYITIFTQVQEALSSDNFDPEDTIFNLITEALGEEPSFDLYERVSMALNLA
jgi:hypothetical protein